MSEQRTAGLSAATTVRKISRSSWASFRKGPGALPHIHPGLEQVCYILEGKARVEVAGFTREIGPGECCFFPAGEPHIFAVVSDEPVKVLVIYSPPYNENPAQAVRA